MAYASKQAKEPKNTKEVQAKETQAKKYSNKLMKINEALMPAIIKEFSSNGIQMNDYQKECGLNAISAIYNLLDAEGIGMNDSVLDQSNLSQIVKRAAANKLNAFANPRECFFQIRNVQIKEAGKYTGNWKKVIEFGIEGDGNDALLRNFGVDVAKVHTPWLVREGDDFEYPKHQGLKKTDPAWTESGEGKVVRVVYPIEKTDGTIDWRIAEREDVRKNLLAHINNNMMNETFGICKDRYKATDKEKEAITAKKSELKMKLNSLDLDQILDDPEFEKWISPAWTEGYSREEMIVRKMRNNAIKKYPKNFGSSYIERIYSETVDSDVSNARSELDERANQGPVIDVDFEEVDDETVEEEEEEVTPEEDDDDILKGSPFENIDPETGEMSDADEAIDGQMQIGASEARGEK